MPELLTVRPMSEEEARTVDRLARSRTESARAVERAQIVLPARVGRRVPVIARELGLCEATVRLWLQRFDAGGLDGLADVPVPGGPRHTRPRRWGR